MKVLIIAAILVPEAEEKIDAELEAEIKAKLKPKDIPWVEKIEKISVLSES